MIRIKTKHEFKKEDFFRKSLKLGYDEVSFGLEFGNRCELIGKLSRIDDDTYKLEIDRVGDSFSTGSIQCLGKSDLGLFRAALENDYQTGEDEYEVI